MDAWGRYKVLFPFDISGRPNGRASPWIRMSQPYTGAGYGQHFPLAPGCEVQVAFTDGDPDRPVITGAVPNAETGSLVNSACPNSSGIGTRGGGSLVFGEVPGKQSATLAGGSGRGAVTLTAGSPTVADVSADVVDSTHAVYGSANFFSGSNTSGGFHEVRASASWARTVSLISSTVRSAAEAASVAAGIAKDKPGTSGTACDIAANAFSLADFAVQPLMRFIQWCLESKKRKEQAALSAADPDWRGPPDDGLFSVEGDSEGCQSAWRANSDFSQGGWQKNLTVFVMVMNALRSAAAGAAGYVAGDDADADQEKEDGEEMEPAVKLSNRICAAGSGAAATLLEIVLLVKMANSFGNPSGKKPKGIHLHNRDSYVTILADTFGALSAKGPLVLESGGKARLGEDMVHETARGIGDLSRLASDENGKSGPGAFSAQNAVLLRGDLVRSMGETVSLGAAKEVAVKSARKIRIASGAVPAYAAPEAAKSALENASAEAKTLDAPAAFDSGISLEAIQDGSVARMCCLDREGAVLLLHGPHQGAKAEANGGSQGGRRLELSPNGALIQNDKDHMLKLSEGGGAELTDANGMSVKLANGEAALRKDGSCSMTLGNGKFSLAGNAGLEVTGGNASKIIMAADGLDLKSQGQLALNAKMTILG
ncbi:MAG: phage baseplate assembly protein V [Deltaproteobacteria bacterium]|nr:phage baseplate assembly protein V [Deltaproteobacteria bacterium]